MPKIHSNPFHSLIIPSTIPQYFYVLTQKPTTEPFLLPLPPQRVSLTKSSFWMIKKRPKEHNSIYISPRLQSKTNTTPFLTAIPRPSYQIQRVSFLEECSLSLLKVIPLYISKCSIFYENNRLISKNKIEQFQTAPTVKSITPPILTHITYIYTFSQFFFVALLSSPILPKNHINFPTKQKNSKSLISTHGQQLCAFWGILIVVGVFIPLLFCWFAYNINLK